MLSAIDYERNAWSSSIISPFREVIQNCYRCARAKKSAAPLTRKPETILVTPQKRSPKGNSRLALTRPALEYESATMAESSHARGRVTGDQAHDSNQGPRFLRE